MQTGEITFLPKVNSLPESVPAAGTMRPSILPYYTLARILDSSSASKYGRPNDFINPSSSAASTTSSGWNNPSSASTSSSGWNNASSVTESTRERLEIFSPKVGTERKRGNPSSKPQPINVKKEKTEQHPTVSIFFLRQGEKAPKLQTSKLELKRRGQYFEAFVYTDRNDRVIPQNIFEHEFLLKSPEPLRSLFCQGDYYFYQQTGLKTLIKTGYSNKNFPDLDVWIALALDSKHSPVIVAPTEFVEEKEISKDTKFEDDQDDEDDLQQETSSNFLDWKEYEVQQRAASPHSLTTNSSSSATVMPPQHTVATTSASSSPSTAGFLY